MTFKKLFMSVLTVPVSIRRTAGKKHKRNESVTADVPTLRVSLVGRFVCDHFIIVITILATNVSDVRVTLLSEKDSHSEAPGCSCRLQTRGRLP